MNGTLLRLLDEIQGGDDEERDDAALLLAAEDQVFRFPPEQSDRLRLAYACSVHRGQGIELPVAVIVAHPAAGAFFLRREMLYTAITRAKLATVIVGTRDVLARPRARPTRAGGTAAWPSVSVGSRSARAYRRPELATPPKPRPQTASAMRSSCSPACRPHTTAWAPRSASARTRAGGVRWSGRSVPPRPARLDVATGPGWSPRLAHGAEVVGWTRARRCSRAPAGGSRRSDSPTASPSPARPSACRSPMATSTPHLHLPAALRR